MKQSKKASVFLMDELDTTVRGPRTSHSSSATQHRRRRALLLPAAAPSDDGIGEKARKNTTPFSSTGNEFHEAKHRHPRPDADVVRAPPSKSTMTRRGGILGRIFGTKSSKPYPPESNTTSSIRNDRSSAVTHATLRSSSVHSINTSGHSLHGPSSPPAKTGGANNIHDDGADEELTEFLHEVQDGTSSIHDLLEGRRWNVLRRYLQTRAGREEVLVLDLDLNAEISSSPSSSAAASPDQDDEACGTSSSGMPNPLHLALWSGAPAHIVAQMLGIRPSLAVHTDDFGRAALHIACLTTHLDLGLEGGDDNGEEEDSEDDNVEDDDDQHYRGHKLDPDLHDGTYDELALSARRLQTAAQDRIRAERRRARLAARRRAQRAERLRIFAILRKLIATDPSIVNRPEAEGLCCIEIAILCGADNEVVYLLRKCSEAHWKEVEAIQKTHVSGSSTCSIDMVPDGHRLVEDVVADMVSRGIVSTNTAAASRVTTSSNTDLTTVVASTSTNTSSDADSRSPTGTANDHDQYQQNRPPLRRGNSWWRLRKRATLSDYLSQSFHKAGPLLAADVHHQTDDNNKTYKTKKWTKTKKNNDNHNKTYNMKTYKTKKRTKATPKPPSKERAYAKYDIAPVAPAVAIDDQIMEGIFADDDVFFSYVPPAGFATAGSSKSSGGTDTNQKMKAAKMSYEPHPYLTFGSDSDSVNSLASSSSELSTVVIPLRDDDRNTYRAVTA